MVYDSLHRMISPAEWAIRPTTAVIEAMRPHISVPLTIRMKYNTKAVKYT
jgi:hypothetical protein